MQPDANRLRVFVGFDPKEMRAQAVALASLRLRSGPHLDVRRVALSELRHRGMYHRETHLMPNGQLWDEISQAPMSTEHAIARFLVPALCGYQGWALFVDGDVLFREDAARLFALADERYAVQVVQHPPLDDEGLKKDGHVQQAYPRKNWSSVMLWHCGHPSNAALTTDVVNAWPGRDLHAFRWLQDNEIGALPARWNWLSGVSVPDPDPALVHFTLGTPDLAGHERDPFADEWYQAARAAGYRWSSPIGGMQQEEVTGGIR